MPQLEPPSMPDVRTPVGALSALLAGNQRFATGSSEHPHQDIRRREALVAGQQPFAVVFSCGDSRIAPEIVFDRGLGDMFTVRVGGHVIDEATLASVEFGVIVAGAPLVVVLGHESCGALQASHAAIELGQRQPEQLRPLVEGTAETFARARDAGITKIDDIAVLHVERTVERLTEGTAIGAAVAAGRCAVVGMLYRLSDGKVTVTTPPPVEI
jgi:carbonic anhydrase